MMQYVLNEIRGGTRRETSVCDRNRMWPLVLQCYTLTTCYLNEYFKFGMGGGISLCCLLLLLIAGACLCAILSNSRPFPFLNLTDRSVRRYLGLLIGACMAATQNIKSVCFSVWQIVLYLWGPCLLLSSPSYYSIILDKLSLQYHYCKRAWTWSVCYCNNRSAFWELLWSSALQFLQITKIKQSIFLQFFFNNSPRKTSQGGLHNKLKSNGGTWMLLLQLQV